MRNGEFALVCLVMILWFLNAGFLPVSEYSELLANNEKKKKRLGSFAQVPIFGYAFVHTHLCVEMYFDFYLMVITGIVRGLIKTFNQNEAAPDC